VSMAPKGSSSNTPAADPPTRDEFTALDAARAKLDTDIATIRSTVDGHTKEMANMNNNLDSILALLNRQSSSTSVPSESTSSLSVRTSTVPESSTIPISSSSDSQTNAPTPNPRPLNTDDPGRHFNIKSEELGTFEGVPEDTALFLANIEAMRHTESDPGWDKALLRTIPRSLRGPARLWLASLTATERTATLKTLDAFISKIRANFKPPIGVIRQQARDRIWQPDTEGIIHYSFLKVALLKTGWPSMSEEELVNEVVDGLEPAVAKLIQTPFRNDPTPTALRHEMRIQETFWRKEYGRPLLPQGSSASSATIPPHYSMVASHAGSSVYATAYPQTTQISARGDSPSASRRPRSIRDDFEPANLSYRLHPDSKKRMMAYKIPGTNRIMCRQRGSLFLNVRNDVKLTTPPEIPLATGKPGEPPPPTAFLAQPAPERTVEGVGGRSYTPTDRCDPPSRHYTSAKGCKSDVERVAVPLGPEGRLDIGYRKISTPGSGRGNGPSPDQTTRGHPQGEYPSRLPNDVADQSAADDIPPHPPPQRDGIRRPPVLHLAHPAWLQRPASLPPVVATHQRPRRELAEVRMPRLKETVSGHGHRRHAPTTCKIRFPDSDLPAVSSLIDTGASLSTIDRGLVERLGRQPQGDTLCINGIGTQNTLGHVTLSFIIEGADSAGNAVRLRFDHDFHVLPAFSPGMCLGQDWISGHQAVVDPAGKVAFVGDYNFPVRSSLPPARTLSAKICTKRDSAIPPSCHTWVEVDTAALLEDVDYMLEPTRAVLGQATALGVGTVFSATSLSFPLAAPASDGEPFDPFEFDEQPAATNASSAATSLVDETWTVGLSAQGQPHASVVDLLRQHKEAFSLDGRPGHIKGSEMRIPVADPTQLKAEAPRRVSLEKRVAIEKQIAQLLEWDVIEESSSPVSAPVHLVRQRDKLRFCVDYRHLNAATTPDRYPLPRIDDVLESLRGASWFSSLDAIRGYHQADIGEEDRWKTAFVTHKGLMQYKRIPFGLRSAPAFFQRLMDGRLGPMRWITALVYVDDIVVYTRTFEEHLDALNQLLSAATAIGLRFSPSKCVFAVRELNPLGRKVSGHGLGVMEDRASAVRDLPAPRTLQERYHVLGLFGYYRQFIPKFAQHAQPLTDLTKGWAYKKCGDMQRLDRRDGRIISAKNEPLDKDGFAAAIHQIHVLPSDSAISAFPAWPQRLAGLDREAWVAALHADPTFGPTVRRLQTTGGHATDEPYVLDDGVLVRRDDGRLCVPRSALVAVLQQVHDQGGHFGLTKTYMAVAAEFWHPRLSSLVTAYVRDCLTCIRTKIGPSTGRLDIEHDATRPFQHTSIDVVLGMPRTRTGKDAVIVAVCTFSKLVLTRPCTSSFTAKDIVDFVLDRVVRMGWRPQRLTSDRDHRIMGEASRQLGQLLGMEITATPAHHHRANPVERHIQTVERVLRAMGQTRQGLWDEEVLPAAELALNSAPSVATGMTPFDAIFINSPRAMDAILRRPDHDGVGDWAERFHRAKFRLLEARDLVRAERVRQRRYFNDHHRPLPAVEPGILVWIRLRNRPIAAAPQGKLAPVKVGPFAVRRVLSPHRVLVDVPGSSGSAPPANPPVPDRARPPPAVPPADCVAPPPRRGTRERQPGPLLRDPRVTLFNFHEQLAAPLAIGDDVLAQPQRRSRYSVLDGVTVQLVERPVAFLSRVTTPAESKLTGPELELTCLAWAMTRGQHLLEGSNVTIVTDHAPIPGMLTSRTGLIPYGPVVEKARVLLRPHLDRLRFVHQPGRTHVNVDALSRLPSSSARPGRQASVAGACDGGDDYSAK
ncbi:hypothetical protein A4X13_0g7923, partial [Tilletia indica]